MQHEAVLQLIEIGRDGEDRVPAAFADSNAAWSIIHHGIIEWDNLALVLCERDLESLIRGFVHYSRKQSPASPGGSVSPVIRLYSSFVSRFPDSEPNLTAWIVLNRVNPYEPFGTLSCNNAVTLDRHLASRAERRARAIENEATENARQAEAAVRRSEIATSRLAAAVKRGDNAAVAALLDQGANPLKALGGGR